MSIYEPVKSDTQEKLSPEAVALLKSLYDELHAIATPSDKYISITELIDVLENGGDAKTRFDQTDVSKPVYQLSRNKYRMALIDHLSLLQYLRYERLYFHSSPEAPKVPYAAHVVDFFVKRKEILHLGQLLVYWRALELDIFFLVRQLIYRHYRRHEHGATELLADAPEATLKFLAADSYPSYRTDILQWLQKLTTLPESLQPRMWELGLKGAKADKPLARALVEKVPGWEAKLISYLKAGDQEIRLQAAVWIAKSKVGVALSALEDSLKKEKSEPVRSALFNGIEAVGGSLDPYLNRETLAKESHLALKKPIPAELAWLKMDSLPPVHWADTQKPVDPAIIKGFLVQSIKLKEPSSVMRRHTSRMVAADKARLADLVLELWMEMDSMTTAEAEAKARLMAETAMDDLKKMIPPANFAKVKLKDLVEMCLRELTEKLTGVSAATKGVLQVVGACAGPDVVQPAMRYMKKWFGYRASHCKALLNMLAMIDHPSSIQALLSVRNKFRTKSIQEEADRLSQELAERKGWTVDEMADRTIPDAGFEQNGVMELSYGPRTFTVKIGASLTPVITESATGREIKSLPTPNKSDDPELAAEAKKTFADAKKELKAVVDLQRDRLYDAMCTERTWTYDVWEQYLATHPIVGRMTQWLVWAEVEKSQITRLFRPMEDGTYTDANHNQVKVQPNSIIKLAHGTLISDEMNDQWTTHLNDYKILPIFTQFMHHKFVLTKEMAEVNEITDRQGYVLDNFKLRSYMTNQGYSRGPVRDAGIFISYEKRFTGLGIQVDLDFTGSTFPEQNQPVALRRISFAQIPKAKEESHEAEPIALKDLPKIFLAECWNHLHNLAAQGTGFDPNWGLIYPR